MILELTKAEVVALRLATEESLASYVEAYPDASHRHPGIEARIATLEGLHQRLAANEIAVGLALAGTPPDLRAGASM